MGIERSITRWLVQRELLLSEENALKLQIEQAATGSAKKSPTLEIEEALEKTQERLRLLGPCPRPMMG